MQKRNLVQSTFIARQRIVSIHFRLTYNIMDSEEQARKILEQLKLKPEHGASDIHTLIEKLKAFKEILKMRMENGQLDPKKFQKIRDELSEAGLVPTYHEIILFFIVLFFIIFVFGKNILFIISLLFYFIFHSLFSFFRI